MFFVFSESSSVRNIKHIQSNLLREIDLAEDNGERIQRILEKKTYSFKSLTEATSYPIFLYKNKSLFYWSTTAIQPVYELFSSNDRIRYLVLKNGAFLCLKRQLILGENEYEIYQLIPLYTKYGFENEYIRNGPNPLIFGKSRVRLNNYGTEGYNFKDDSGNYLFSVEKFYPERRSFEYLYDGSTIVFYGVIFMLFWVGYIYLSKRNTFVLGEYRLLYWTGIYFAFKFLALQIGFPAQFMDTHLFDPRYMTSALWATSLGDIFVDSVCLLLFSLFVFRIFSRLSFVGWVLKCENQKLLYFILGIIFIAIHGSLLLVFYVVGIIYEKAGVSLDFLLSYGFTIEKVVGLLVFLSYSLVFFLINQLVVRLTLHITKILGRRKVIFTFIVSTFLYVMVTGIINYSFLLITLLSSFYFLLAWWFSLPMSLNKLRFDTYIYFFTCAIVCASVGAYSAFRHTKYRLINEKVAFARQVLEENDFLAESLLKEAAAKIVRDPFISRQMVGPFINEELVEQKIRKIYLNNYFNRFTVKITLFDASGNPYFNLPGTPNAIRLKKILEGKNFVTEVPNLFFVKNLKGNIVKQYFYFIPIKRANVSIGEILLEISPKRNLPPVNVYPALLISQPEGEMLSQKDFEYAIYQDSLLVYSSGAYNYLSDFNIKLFQNSASKEIIYNREGFDHVVIKEGNNKTIVVSSLSLPWMNLLTLFSFLFLVLLFLSTVFVILYTILVQRDLFSANFTTKIQIYINLAFFLPLFVISVAT
ncbi:MAG: hypothetical protein K2Q22_11550, partial [Cytophagales bacterium]|nr:hypothetical protein [Cytophagales bacterium]